MHRLWAVNIKANRTAKHRDWTQDELASRVGVTRQAISQWETGVSVPKDDFKLALAEAFEIDVRTLFPLVRVGSPLVQVVA